MLETIDKLAIDLFFGSDSVFLDHFALIMTNAWTWTPMLLALLLLVIKNNDNMQMIGLCMLCAVGCVLISSGLANIVVKPLVERIRPCNDPAIKYLAQIAGNIHSKDFSFFSSHAANTMSLAFFLTLLVRNKVLSCVLFSWSLLNCWTRLYLGQHFFTDVLTGIIVGIVVGVVMYIIYLKLVKQMGGGRSYISSQYTTTGFSLLDIDIVVTCFILSILVALIPASYLIL